MLSLQPDHSLRLGLLSSEPSAAQSCTMDLAVQRPCSLVAAPSESSGQMQSIVQMQSSAADLGGLPASASAA